MPGHDDDDGQQEGGELLGDGAVVAEAAEGQGDEEGQNGDDHLLHHAQDDVLEFLENSRNGLGLGPHGGKADEDGKDQGAHDGHDLGNVQLEGHARQLLQSLHAGGDGQEGHQDIARDHGHQGGQDGADIGHDDGHHQHTGGVGAHLRDGGGDEANDNEGYAEHDELVENVLEGDYDGHDAFRQEQSADDAHGNADQQL